MADRHLYEVHLDDGSRYDVTTPHHHDDHHQDDFLRHLLDIIKSAAGGVISGVIVRFIHRGRR